MGLLKDSSTAVTQVKKAKLQPANNNANTQAGNTVPADNAQTTNANTQGTAVTNGQ